jgi:5'-deoxynucleotidase YfbR-like HD superfamily hydrolase
MKFKIKITKKTDIEKEEKCEKEIEDLVGKYGWRLERKIRTPLPDYVISVITDFPSGTNRPYTEINKFKDKLANILQNCGLEIRAFGETISNDLRNRRIDIETKKRN